MTLVEVRGDGEVLMVRGHRPGGEQSRWVLIRRSQLDEMLGALRRLETGTLRPQAPIHLTLVKGGDDA